MEKVTKKTMIIIGEGEIPHKQKPLISHGLSLLDGFVSWLFLCASLYGLSGALFNGFFSDLDYMAAWGVACVMGLWLLVWFRLPGKAFLYGSGVTALVLVGFVGSNLSKFGASFEGMIYYFENWIGWYYQFSSPKMPDSLMLLNGLWIQMPLVLAMIPWSVLLTLSWGKKRFRLVSFVAMMIYISLFLGVGYMPERKWLLWMVIPVIAAYGRYLYSTGHLVKQKTNVAGRLHRSFIITVVLLACTWLGLGMGTKLEKKVDPVRDWAYDLFSGNFHHNYYDYSKDSEETTEHETDPKETTSKPEEDRVINGAGINGGYFGRGGQFKPKGTTVMSVYFDKDVNHYTYLKGYVGDTYTGKSWDANVTFQNTPPRFYMTPYDVMSREYTSMTEFIRQCAFFSDYSNFYDKQQGEWVSEVRDPETGEKWVADITDEEVLNNLQYFVGAVSSSEKQSFINLASIVMNGTVQPGDFVYYPYAAMVSEVDGEAQNGYYLQSDVKYKNPTSYFSMIDFKGGIQSKTVDSMLEVATRPELRQYKRHMGMGELDDILYKYARENYLEVPSQLAWLQEEYHVDYENEKQAVVYVLGKLSDGFSYSKNPGLTPKNRDFIDYFLKDSKTGFCVYFASAATMMFRSMGIPARYVEGYLVPPVKAGEEAQVTDEYAHAWTEIFVKGYGWVPVDATPGYSRGENPIEINQKPDPEPPATTVAPTTTARAPKETTAHATSATATMSSEKENNGSEKKVAAFFWRFVLIVVSVPATGVALYFLAMLGYMIYWTEFYKRQKHMLARQHVLAVCREMYRFTKHASIPLDPETEEARITASWPIRAELAAAYCLIGKKAAFSGEMLSSEEAKVVDSVAEFVLLSHKRKIHGMKKRWYLLRLSCRRKIYAGKGL